MDLGYFMMPAHPPERKPYDWQQTDLQNLRLGDEMGVKEAWIGEHFTVSWEPNPAPDLTIAQALLTTSTSSWPPARTCYHTTIRSSWHTVWPFSIIWRRAGCNLASPRAAISVTSWPSALTVKAARTGK
jgi:hypothetical protein